MSLRSSHTFEQARADLGIVALADTRRSAAVQLQFAAPAGFVVRHVLTVGGRPAAEPCRVAGGDRGNRRAVKFSKRGRPKDVTGTPPFATARAQGMSRSQITATLPRRAPRALRMRRRSRFRSR